MTTLSSGRRSGRAAAAHRRTRRQRWVGGTRAVVAKPQPSCPARVIALKVQSLRREKDDVTEVRDGYECGLTLSYSDIKEGDVI